MLPYRPFAKWIPNGCSYGKILRYLYSNYGRIGNTQPTVHQLSNEILRQWGTSVFWPRTCRRSNRKTYPVRRTALNACGGRAANRSGRSAHADLNCRPHWRKQAARSCRHIKLSVAEFVYQAGPNAPPAYETMLSTRILHSNGIWFSMNDLTQTLRMPIRRGATWMRSRRGV